MRIKIQWYLWPISFALFSLLVFGLPAMAKKGKKEGSQIKPQITAEQAIDSVKAGLSKMSTGKAFIKEDKRGEKKMEVPLVLEGKIVARVRVNPANGEILSKGYKPSVQQVTFSPEQAAAEVQKSLPNFQVGSARVGKSGEWKVELTLKGSAVADIGVNGKDGSILPDWKASKDATLLGQ
jgi:hypothetical protein